eukprot:gene2051-2526_t
MEEPTTLIASTTTTTTNSLKNDENNNNNNDIKKPLNQTNWKIIATSNNPTPRFEFSFTYYKNNVYMFGGNDNKETTFPVFQKLSLSDYGWQILTCPFPTRILHTGVIYNDALYIFGGGVYEDERVSLFKYQKVFKTIDHLLKYSFNDREWTKIENEDPNTKILSRDGHASVVVGNEMFVIGGSKNITQKNGSLAVEFYREVSIYNFVTNTWRSIPAPSIGRLCSAVHYQSIDGCDYIYVFGGYEANTIPVQDFYQLDLSTEKWTKVSINSDTIPPSRYGHTTHVLNDKLYLYGGYSKKGYLRDFYYFDLIEKVWVNIETEGPTKRKGHRSVLVHDESSTLPDKIVLYGGTYTSSIYNDLWEYQFPPSIHIPLDSNQDDFRNLFENSQDYFSDVVFLVEDKQIHAHRNILAIRSNYFKSLFKSGLKETFDKEIIIKDEKYQDFKTFLEYIYTGNEHLVQLENCLALLHLSDLYGIQRLKTICESKAVDDLFGSETFYSNNPDMSTSTTLHFNFINTLEIPKLCHRFTSDQIEIKKYLREMGYYAVTPTKIFLKYENPFFWTVYDKAFNKIKGIISDESLLYIPDQTKNTMLRLMPVPSVPDTYLPVER